MVFVDGYWNIEAQVLVQSHNDEDQYDVAQEYDDPDQDMDTNTASHKHIKYIEAQSERKFQITMTLKTGFDFISGDLLAYWFGLDGVSTGGRVFYKLHCREVGGILSTPRSQTISDQIVTLNGEARSITFAFSEVSLDDEITEGRGAQMPQGQGTIDLRFQRGTAMGPTPFKPEAMNKAPHLDKKAIVRGISHTIKPGSSEAVKATPTRLKSCPLQGVHDRCLHVQFRYRSRKSLQQIGCIPEDPEPVNTNQTASHETELEQLRQRVERQASEILRLKTDNHALTRSATPTGLGGRQTAASTPTGPPSAGVNFPQLVKREHEDSIEEEGDSDIEVVHVGKRIKRETEVIELD